MSDDPSPDASRPADDPAWVAREISWQRKLGRLRLGAEPIEEQLSRFRQVILLSTVLSSALAIVFVSLFTAFGRPDIGVGLVLVLIGPFVLLSWRDHSRLRANASAYLQEQREYQARRARSETPNGVK